MSDDVGLAHPDRFFIDGQWQRPSSAATITVMDSVTGLPFFSVAEARADDVGSAVAAARQAFDAGPWPRLSHAERANYLRAIAEALRRRKDTEAQLWPRESGVLYGAAQMSCEVAARRFEYYADLATAFPFAMEVTPSAGGAYGLSIQEPVGVVGAIIPWNGPLALIATKIAPALLAGCTVILKSSPEAPGEGCLMGEVAEEIGLPAGVLNTLTADREVSELLVRDPRVDKITFTGSTAAGRRIGGICGERVARCTLELGGKSPAVVLDDIDLGEVARSVVSAECFISGQVCYSLTRIIVSRQRHDGLVDALASAFDGVRVGDPFDPETQMGPLASERQRERVLGYIRGGLRDGAFLAAGGGIPRGLEAGFYVEPTVFGAVDNASAIAQEEIFGPVLCVIPADDEQDAVKLANATIYGLNASVYTDDVDRARAVASQLRAGTVGHNASRTDSLMGYGGFKQSGIGREGGIEGLRPFLELKSVILDAIPTPVAEWSPRRSHR